MAFINFVRDYERIARFRLGKFEGMRGPGIVLSIPILHQIQKIDTRVIVLDIPRQTNITKDNAPIEIDFLIYMRIDLTNGEKAVLEVENYTQAVVGLATTTLRAVIGDISLDEVLSQRDRINELIRVRLDAETERWGIKVTNVEIREIDPPRDIQEAMNRQMSAERVRRAVVIEADGQRQSDITVAEGQKASEILKAEGDKQAQILSAEGEREAAVLRAQGFADALQKIYDVAQNVDKNTMTLQYVEALKAMAAGASTKWILPMELTNMLGTLGALNSPDDSEDSN